MTFKFNKVAAAVAMALAAGAANAAIDVGDLFFVYDKETSSASFDLGINMAQFTAASAQASTAGSSIVWNFAANTVTVNGFSGYTGATSGLWSSAWSSIGGGAGTYGVLAVDGNAGKIVTTSSSSNAVTAGTTDTEIFGTGSVQGYIDSMNAAATHLGNPVGASFENAPASPALHNNGFGLSDKWGDNVPFTALGSSSSSLGFWEMDGQAGAPWPKYKGTFSLDAASGTLTYSVAAIPEPSTYALLAAGMVVIGVFARRRSA